MLVHILIFMLGLIFGVCALAMVSINRSEEEELRNGVDERV